MALWFCTECSKVYHYSFYGFEKRAYVQTDTQPGNRKTGLWYHHIIVNRAESHPMSSYPGMQRQMWLMKVGNHSNASPVFLIENNYLLFSLDILWMVKRWDIWGQRKWRIEPASTTHLVCLICYDGGNAQLANKGTLLSVWIITKLVHITGWQWYTQWSSICRWHGTDR